MMKFAVSNITILVAVFAVAGVAQAGPAVSITFKNNGASDVNYDALASNAYSYADSNPKPPSSVVSGATSFFTVKGAQSSDVTVAAFQYRVGARICKFRTSYVKITTRSGVVPKWNKSVTSEGGARCDVKVTSVNVGTHDWAVEFTMR